MPNKVEDKDIVRKWVQLRDSASTRGLEFNLSLNTVKRLLQRKTCYYTKLNLTYGTDHQLDNPLKRTVDRVDPSKGYVEGNVVACCHAANKFKSKIEHEFDGLLSRKRVVTLVQRMFMEKK